VHKHKGEQNTSLLSHFVSITDNEDRGIKEVVNFYGGQCEYSIGTDFSSKYFELKLSKSEVVEKYADMPDVCAAGVAYRFYKNLQKENKNYDSVSCILLFNNGTKFASRYSRAQLELISAKIVVANEAIDSIKEKNFSGLKPLLSDESYTENEKNQLITGFQNEEPALGEIKEFMPLGFRFENLNGFNVVDVVGLILRAKQNIQFSAKIDLTPGESKIHFIDYHF
jgi:hypothetical protein